MGHTDYCLNQGIEKLKGLFGNPVFEDWYFQTAEYPDGIYNTDLIRQTNTYQDKEVDLKQVVGTIHPNYCGKRWIEILGCLSRDTRKRTVAELEKWIRETSKEIIMVKFGNRYYVSGDGNHRTCYAKFLGWEKLVVGKVYEYETDPNMDALLNQFMERYIQVSSFNYHWFEIVLDNRKVNIPYEKIQGFLSYFDEVQLTLRNLLLYWSKVRSSELQVSQPTLYFLDDQTKSQKNDLLFTVLRYKWRDRRYFKY